jgi:hypothetical protein
MSETKQLQQLTGEIRLRHTAETKGTHKYEECDRNGDPEQYAYQRVGTVYIKKSAFKSVASPPKFLRVTISIEGGN